MNAEEKLHSVASLPRCTQAEEPPGTAEPAFLRAAVIAGPPQADHTTSLVLPLLFNFQMKRWSQESLPMTRSIKKNYAKKDG